MDLQTVISELAERLNKPVAVNDFDLNLIAASAQDLDIDPYRVESILRRRTPAAVVSLLQERGLLERSDPFVLEGGVLPGLRPRMCIPISLKGRNVAFLWIVLDTDAGLTSAEYNYARTAAEEIRRMLAVAPAPGVDMLVTHSRQIQRLIHPDAVTAGYAVAELASEQGLEHHSALTTTVYELEALDESHAGATGMQRPDLGRLAAPALAPLDPSSLLGIVDGALVLVSAAATQRDQARRVESAAERSLNAAHHRIRGIGTSSSSDWKEGLRDVYLEAAYAARIAGRVPEAPHHAVYDHLGALVLFRQVPWIDKSVAQISADAATLIAEGNRVNTQTLLTYLRLAGDVQRTCSAMNIHRTTLYYRLDRCRDHIGDALEHGWRRTSLYLGLVLAEITAQAGNPSG